MNHHAFSGEPAPFTRRNTKHCASKGGGSVFSKKYQEQKSSSSFLEKKTQECLPLCRAVVTLQTSATMRSFFAETLLYRNPQEKGQPFFFPAINKTLACAKTSDLREGMLEYYFSASIHKRMVSGTPLRQFLPKDLSFSRFTGGQRAFWV